MAYDPRAHAVQRDALASPTPVEYVPGAQGLQPSAAAAAVEEEYVPAEQAAHAPAALLRLPPAAKVPAGHRVQLSAPFADWYVPAAQSRHAVSRDADAKAPAAQDMQTVHPPLDVKVPEAHAAHPSALLSPTKPPYVPAGQAMMRFPPPQ